MSVIDDYLSNLGEAQRSELERIRQIVHQTVPNAQEVISYGMPAFTYKTKYLVGFDAFKDHLSLFPTSEPIEVLRDRLQSFKLSRGTIQFRLEQPIPTAIITRLLEIRVASISDNLKTTTKEK